MEKGSNEVPGSRHQRFLLRCPLGFWSFQIGKGSPLNQRSKIYGTSPSPRFANLYINHIFDNRKSCHIHEWEKEVVFTCLFSFWERVPSTLGCAKQSRSLPLQSLLFSDHKNSGPARHLIRKWQLNAMTVISQHL